MPKVKKNPKEEKPEEEEEDTEIDWSIVHPMQSFNGCYRPISFDYSEDRRPSRSKLVLLYARLGLHRYNLLWGKNLQLICVTQYTMTGYSAASAYNISLKFKDPETTGISYFHSQVHEKKYGSLFLDVPSSGPIGAEPLKPIKRLDGDFMPEFPSLNPFNDDTGRFHLLKKSEVVKNDWIHLYLQLAVATSYRRHTAEGVSNLKILKVAMEITQDLTPFTMRLGAYDAVFYIRYMDSCKARVGDDVDRVAIVRRIMDVQSEVFRLMGNTYSSQTLLAPSPNGIATVEAGPSSAQE